VVPLLRFDPLDKLVDGAGLVALGLEFGDNTKFLAAFRLVRLNQLVDPNIVKKGYVVEAGVGAIESFRRLLVQVVIDEDCMQAKFVRVFEMDSVANLKVVGNPRTLNAVVSYSGSSAPKPRPPPLPCL